MERKVLGAKGDNKRTRSVLDAPRYNKVVYKNGDEIPNGARLARGRERRVPRGASCGLRGAVRRPTSLAICVLCPAIGLAARRGVSLVLFEERHRSGGDEGVEDR